ncbi:MAG: hypothetical protein RLZZ196_3742 [Bacteroidota bacterium]|jgi:transposase
MEKQKLIEYIELGFSISEISKLENRSNTTVRYWLNKFKLKTKNKSFKNGYLNKNISKIQKIDGIPIQHCSECKILLNNENGYWRKNKSIWSSKCKQCTSKQDNRWRNNKQKAVEYKGGKCQHCGYNKCIDALEFHHTDPSTKNENFSNIKLKKWETQKQELDKCILLCSNCHREVHYKLRNNA